MRGKRAIPVLNTAIFNSTYSGGMDVPELRLNLGGKRIGPQKIAELARWDMMDLSLNKCHLTREIVLKQTELVRIRW